MGREREYRLDIPFDSMTCIIDIENSRTGVPVFHLDSLQNPKDTPMQDVSMTMIILVKTKQVRPSYVDFGGWILSAQHWG
mmetsp:Transcript_10769/g.27249  ORF Transcript_10769/g.27249 Transcript_10769/m.27249 type:complete len:80 (-) Transcript_10769:320-559(-)